MSSKVERRSYTVGFRQKGANRREYKVFKKENDAIEFAENQVEDGMLRVKIMGLSSTVITWECNHWRGGI
jgi:hypothetical protein